RSTRSGKAAATSSGWACGARWRANRRPGKPCRRRSGRRKVCIPRSIRRLAHWATCWRVPARRGRGDSRSGWRLRCRPRRCCARAVRWPRPSAGRGLAGTMGSRWVRCRRTWTTNRSWRGRCRAEGFANGYALSRRIREKRSPGGRQIALGGFAAGGHGFRHFQQRNASTRGDAATSLDQAHLERVVDEQSRRRAHGIFPLLARELHFSATCRQPLELDLGCHGRGPEVGHRGIPPVDGLPRADRAALHAQYRRDAKPRWMVRATILVLAAIAANVAGAHNWGEEYARRIRATEAVSPLGDAMFGDQVNLFNGTVTFSATHVSIPGNSSLPVAPSRSYD